MNPSRPITVTIAIVLFLLLTVFGLITFFVLDAPPILRYYGLIVAGIGGLIAVAGLWMVKRWGLWLTIVISAATILLYGPGLWFAPDAGKLMTVALIVVDAVVLVLLTRPATRRAFASARASVA